MPVNWKDTGGIKFAIFVAIAVVFVLVVFLTSRDTGPSAEIDEDAAAEQAEQAREKFEDIEVVAPSLRPPTEWEDTRPTDPEFRGTIERFCNETAAIRAEEDKRLDGVAVNQNWRPADIEAADAKAAAAEARRLYNALERAGLPASQAATYRAWRASVRQLGRVSLDYSAAVTAEKTALANELSGRISALESESRGLAAQFGVDCSAT
jgi:hypothetical protein